MDDRRFDSLARSLATPGSRRTLIKTFGATVLGGLAGALGRDAADAASCTKGGAACGPTKPACCKGFVCTGGFCVAACTPNCAGKTCGPDGCGGVCGSGTCPGGQGCCGGACADLTTTSNCGACGIACKAGQSCVNGKCAKRCTPTSCAAQGKTCGSIPDGCGGTLTCGTCPAAPVCQVAACSNGTCVNNPDPVQNGASCGGGKVCQNGTCACPSGTRDCGGTCQQCCQTADCPTPPTCSTATCSGGVCGLQGIPGCCTENGQCDDLNPCTVDTCTTSTHTCNHANEASGTSCSHNGGIVCNGSGACVQCLSPTDCPGIDTACQTRTCTAGACGVAFAAQGTPTPPSTQTAGDCHKTVCDGAGGQLVVVDDSDVPDDGNECTLNVCTAGVPSNPPHLPGTACTQGGGSVCDGTGRCVQCVTPVDCPGSDTDCQARTCANGTCGIVNASAGTPTSTQTAGDCRKTVCDGQGGVVSQVDDTDVPGDDGNQCTAEVCTAGVPSHPAKQAGTVCSQGGIVCDGAGNCVQCLTGTDCPGTDTECRTRTCTAGTCGVAVAESGTPTPTQIPGDCQRSACDADGNVVFVDDDSDLPVDGNQCTYDICANGTPSHRPVERGTACSQNGGSVCDGAGACVIACDPGTHPCGGVCVVDTALTACGASCIDCGSTADACIDGHCVCGSTGAACPPGQVCQNGACAACSPATCPNGCCDAHGACIIYDRQSPTTCGQGGAACAPCGENLACTRSGTCCPSGQTCGIGTGQVVGFCCPAGEQCNGLGGCCAPGRNCINGSCCPVGQVCTGLGCCPAEDVCTAPNGTKRCCTGAQTCGANGLCCTTGGNTCSTNAQCCSGICAGGTCQETCGDLGAVCDADGDCCSASSCCFGTCAVACTVGETFTGGVDATCRCGEGCCGSGDVCLANGTCCTPESLKATCSQRTQSCGPAVNNCGQVVNCGTCPAGIECIERNCCTPESAATTCARANRTCGFAENDCGAAVNCGSCGSEATCFEGQCCPSSQYCGSDLCCPEGRTCCRDFVAGRNVCCAPGDICTANGCSQGIDLCGGACPEGTQCTGGACCPPSQVCGVSCCGNGQTCVNNQCCNARKVCTSPTGENFCCPSNQLCWNGTCCPYATYITSTTSCCVDHICNHTICCATGKTCCADGKACCGVGETCCNGTCCKSGQHCCGDFCCDDGHRCCGGVVFGGDSRFCCAPGLICCNTFIGPDCTTLCG